MVCNHGIKMKKWLLIFSLLCSLHAQDGTFGFTLGWNTPSIKSDGSKSFDVQPDFVYGVTHSDILIYYLRYSMSFLYDKRQLTRTNLFSGFSEVYNLTYISFLSELEYPVSRYSHISAGFVSKFKIDAKQQLEPSNLLSIQEPEAENIVYGITVGVKHNFDFGYIIVTPKVQYEVLLKNALKDDDCNSKMNNILFSLSISLN